jgi:hypothetical protein
MANLNLNGGINVINFPITADTYSVSASVMSWIDIIKEPNVSVIHVKQLPQTISERMNTIMFKACDDSIISSFTVTQTRGYEDIYLYANKNIITFDETNSGTSVVYYDLYIGGDFITPTNFLTYDYSSNTDTQYASVSGSDVEYHTLRMKVDYNKELDFPTEITCNVFDENKIILTSSTISINKTRPFTFYTETSKIEEMFNLGNQSFDDTYFYIRVENDQNGLIDFYYEIHAIYDETTHEIIGHSYIGSIDYSELSETFPGYDAETQSLTCIGETKLSINAATFGSHIVSSASCRNQPICVNEGDFCDNPSVINLGEYGDVIDIYLTENV